jgi:hypothetical protein
MRKQTLLLLISFSIPIWGQGWQQIQLDTFYVNEKAEICMKAQDHFGFAFRETRPENYPEKFWIDGNIYFSGDPAGTEAFFVFGSDSADTPLLWAAGYSLAQKHILLGRIDISEGENIRFPVLAKKPVEIIDHRFQNVYRLIFIHGTGEIKVEVNGVPMIAKCPIDTRSIRYFGYMVKGQSLRFEELRFDGE